MQESSSKPNDELTRNFRAVEREIATACHHHARDRREVALVAVSKGHDFSLIEAAYQLGQRDFGENYAQELAQKIQRAKERGMLDIRWHFIGAIQSNKIPMIALAQVVESIGSVRHAKLLYDAVTTQTDIFLQVNLNGDTGRQGFLCSEIVSAIGEISSLGHKLRIQGLMAILPIDDDHAPAYWFAKMSALRRSILEQGTQREVKLSMGMSDDFAEAIAYGANLVRIGTRIFGERQ